MKQTKVKGSFSDLKPALKSLKGLYEEIEATESKKESVEDIQERDLRNIKRQGYSDNR